MNIHLENVNLNSTSGPNSFGQKLVKYLPEGNNLSSIDNADVRLCFIESPYSAHETPLVQRLDGIYFNDKQDYNAQNSNIKRTYKQAASIIFQSEFSKNLVTRWFGDHENYTIVHNGADIEKINSISAIENKALDRYDNVWCCASHWRPHKRLSENIRYFLEHSSERDCLVVAGETSKKINHERIYYTGNLQHETLIALYKRSSTFIHLGRFDNCPNVVVDAPASGCHIVCASLGGTIEIAGANATVLQEEPWDYQPLDLYNPPNLDFSKKQKNVWNIDINMKKVAEKYVTILKSVLEK